MTEIQVARAESPPLSSCGSNLPLLCRDLAEIYTWLFHVKHLAQWLRWWE